MDGTKHSPGCVFDEACIGYTKAVLSYAPYAKWHNIIEALEKLQKGGAINIPFLYFVFSADAYIGPFQEVEKAKVLIQNLLEESKLKTANVLSNVTISNTEMFILDGFAAWILENDCKKAFHFFMEALNQNNETMPELLQLFLCKRAQLMALLGGFNEKIITPAELLQQSCPNAKYLMGMLAFGHEQNGAFEKAEQVAKYEIDIVLKSGEAERVDGWLDHAYAHSLYFQGPTRMPDAQAFLKKRSATWTLDNMCYFLYSHLWWHYALVLIEDGNVDEAVRIFDENLWPKNGAESSFREDIQVQLNAMELLWKLESLQRSDLARPRWQSVISVAKSFIGRRADLLHEVLLLRGLLELDEQNDVKKLMNSIKSLGDRDDYKKYQNICDCVVQICSKTTTDRERDIAREKLKSMRNDWVVVGNSTEQRAVFVELAEASSVVCGVAATSIA